MRNLIAGLAVLLLAFVLGGCGVSARDAPTAPAPTFEEELVVSEQWVVVTFGSAEEEMPAGWMDALLPVEMEAAEALEASGLGYIDGNEIGDFSYELYFVGSDASAMWKVIAPSFTDAPVAWTRVELRDGLEDGHPTVLEP